VPFFDKKRAETSKREPEEVNRGLILDTWSFSLHLCFSRFYETGNREYSSESSRKIALVLFRVKNGSLGNSRQRREREIADFENVSTSAEMKKWYDSCLERVEVNEIYPHIKPNSFYISPLKYLFLLLHLCTLQAYHRAFRTTLTSSKLSYSCSELYIFSRLLETFLQ